MPEKFDEPDQFLKFVVTMHKEFADMASCSQRRQQRLPLQLRQAYAALKDVSAEHERRSLQRVAWKLRLEWHRHGHQQVLTENVRRGGVMQK